MVRAVKCDCIPGEFLCKEAEWLWHEANDVYHLKGYDAWRTCEELRAYNQHVIASETILDKLRKPLEGRA